MFEPYIVETLDCLFMIATEQGQRWYDPLPAPLRLELEWIQDNIDLGKGRQIIDGGCHHGLYSVVMGRRGADVWAVDLHKPNVDITRANCALNGVRLNYGVAAITGQVGWVKCKDAALGAVEADGEDLARSVGLMDICPTAQVIKLDIEGCEFLVLPEALEEMHRADTWIVEIHPWWFEVSGNKDLFGPFSDAGYDLWWIDRAEGEAARVEHLTGEVMWKKESTLIARKRRNE